MNQQIGIGIEFPRTGERYWSLDSDVLINGETWLPAAVSFQNSDKNNTIVEIEHDAPFELIKSECRVHFFRYDDTRWIRMPFFYPGVVASVSRTGSGLAKLTLVPNLSDRSTPNPRYFSHASQSALHPDDLFFANAQKWIDRRKVAEFLWPSVTRALPGGDVISKLPDDITPVEIDLIPIIMAKNTRKDIGNPKWLASRRSFPADAEARTVSKTISRFGIASTGIGFVTSRGRSGLAVGEFRIRNAEERVLLIYRQEALIADADRITWHEFEKGLTLSIDYTSTDPADDNYYNTLAVPAQYADIVSIQSRIPAGQRVVFFGEEIGEALIPGLGGAFDGLRVIDTAPEHLPPALLIDSPILLATKDQVIDTAARFDQNALPFNVDFQTTAGSQNAVGYILRNTTHSNVTLDPVFNGDYPARMRAQRTPVGAVGDYHDVIVRVSGITPVVLPPVVFYRSALPDTSFSYGAYPGWPTPDFGADGQPRFDGRFLEGRGLTYNRAGQNAVSVAAGHRSVQGDKYSGYIRGNGITYRFNGVQVGAGAPRFTASNISGSYVSYTTDSNGIGELRMRAGQTCTITSGFHFGGNFTLNNQFPEVANIVSDKTAGTITITAQQKGMTTTGTFAAWGRIIVIE